MTQICIIEDDPWLAQLLALHLQHGVHNARIHCFQSLQPALKHLREQPLDLLLCDLKLPDGSGLEALETASKQHPNSQRILLTAHIERHNVLAARRAGASDFIAKPFTMQRLLERLHPLSTTGNQPADAGKLTDLDSFLRQRLQQTLYLPWSHQAQHSLASQLGRESNPRDLVRMARLEPMLCAELIAAANRLDPDSKGFDCLSAETALRKLGPDASLSLIRQLLNTRTVLREPALVALATGLAEQQTQLARTLTRYRTELHTSVDVVRAAISLSQIGELSVLCAIQNFINYSQHMDAAALPDLMRKYASEYGNQLKIRLKLPFPLRQLIGALFVLPKTQVHKDQIIMRIAALETGLADNPEEQAQLKRQIKLG